MRCLYPRTVGFKADGNSIAWSQKERSREYAPFQLPCGKCIDCRLEYARSWAIRCVHEAQMHEKNSFITLTYDDEYLPKDRKLDYRDFQLFMKRLRKLQDEPIGVFVTGEYGDKTKRPHWHACLFGWSPSDPKFKYTNERGDQNFSSETLTNTWGLGLSEFGQVTIHSASYCARYAAKKLVHGADGTHEFNPISRKSSKHAIGKRFLESYYKDIFSVGKCVLRDGTHCSIPRYYEKWLKEKHPDEWLRYIRDVKSTQQLQSTQSLQRQMDADLRDYERGRGIRNQAWLDDRADARKTILEQKLNHLLDHEKI
nr:MAG: replication initiator protein [Microvirus sp.]